MEEYCALCKNIDCDFEKKDAFVYSLDNRKKLDRELKALDKLGVGAEFVKDNRRHTDPVPSESVPS